MDYMNNIDKKSLEIESLIRSYIKETNYNKIELIGVFFHELMIYATNYYVIKNSNENYSQDIKFPFLNSDYIENTPKIKFNNIKNNNKIYKLLELFQRLLPLKKIIYISSSNSHDIKLFILKHLFKYRFKQVNLNLYLEDWDYQISIIKNLLSSICDLIDVFDHKDNFINNFIEYVNSYKSDKKVLLQKNSYLLIDSNMSIQNRINSISFLQNNKKVISLGHGEHSIQVFDEPIISYGELSYVTDYITYGQNIIQLESTVFKTPKIYYRNSNKILKYFINKEIKFRTLDKTVKVLYVPTSFSGNMRYGPYRDIEDKDYAKWQQAIFDNDYNITYKQHLNVHYKIDFKIDKLETKQLSKVMHKYDIYILDYISTASALLFATNKPIIFFDIGLRNLHENVKTDFENRVFLHKVNLNNNLNDQISNTFNQYNNNKKQYTNTYTQKYSIDENNKNYINIIKQIIGDK